LNRLRDQRRRTPRAPASRLKDAGNGERASAGARTSDRSNPQLPPFPQPLALGDSGSPSAGQDPCAFPDPRERTSESRRRAALLLLGASVEWPGTTPGTVPERQRPPVTGVGHFPSHALVGSEGQFACPSSPIGARSSSSSYRCAEPSPSVEGGCIPIGGAATGRYAVAGLSIERAVT
jgi:hypothetical protein